MSDETPKDPYKPDPPGLSLIRVMMFVAIALHVGSAAVALFTLFSGGPIHQIVAAVLGALISGGWAAWATNQDREERAAHMFGPTEDPVRILSDMRDDTGTERNL